MRTRQIAAAVTTTVVAAAALLTIGAARTPDPAQASAASPGNRDVIVHLFEWPWASVANECRTVLGPKGFGAVQVSPPQEHVSLPGKGYPWWQDYQPVSYQLTSRRGDREAFRTMVQTCHDAGVKIYVDAVVNHAAGGSSTGPGTGGSTYTHYAYPAVPYGFDDFHHCGRNNGDDIANYGDRWEVQNCELVDLADLKTESPYVRGKLTAYLNDLVSLKVDGFRVDGGKHIPSADLAAILAPVTGNPYVYTEAIEGAGEPVVPEEFSGIGDVTEFRYGDVVGGAFRDGNLSGLNNLAASMRLPSADAVAFIDNHDTQRNGRARLTYKNGSAYALAEAFMIAWPYGVPQVMSSFTFTNNEAGPPAAADGTTTAVTCGTGWACEHRWRTTANMVALRNAAAGAPVTNWWSNGGNEIAFGRGSAGFVAFNRGASPSTHTFQTSLPAGTYCDAMAGDATNGSCSGPTYTVDGSSRVTATVPAGGALALHIGARTTATAPQPGACATVTTSVDVDASTVWGENVFIVGNIAELGNWDPANAVALSSAAYPHWRASLTLPGGATIAYKYVKKNGSQVVWESDPNRSRTTPTTGTCTADWADSWR